MKRNDHWRGAASVNDGGVSKNGVGCYKGRPNVYRWTIGYWTFKEHLKNQERERALECDERMYRFDMAKWTRQSLERDQRGEARSVQPRAVLGIGPDGIRIMPLRRRRSIYTRQDKHKEEDPSDKDKDGDGSGSGGGTKRKKKKDKEKTEEQKTKKKRNQENRNSQAGSPVCNKNGRKYKYIIMKLTITQTKTNPFLSAVGCSSFPRPPQVAKTAELKARCWHTHSAGTF